MLIDLAQFTEQKLTTKHKNNSDFNKFIRLLVSVANAPNENDKEIFGVVLE